MAAPDLKNENLATGDTATGDTASQDIAHQLLCAEAFTHPVSHLKLLETHISWVLLTGEYAYKIKKPVKLPFVDYSTLSQRASFCHEELRLNAPLAPDIYLRVVPIMNCAGKMRVDYDGVVVDYAVCMREFPQKNIFDSLLLMGELTTDHVDQLGWLVAKSHQQAEVSDQQDSASFVQQLRSLSTDNTSFLSNAISDQADLQQLEMVTEWIDDEFDRLAPLFARRLEDGFVRRCHGDMHLQNIIVYNGNVEVFDCIEFNRDLQFIDTINDIAFPAMDLIAHDRADLASRLLTIYLEATGDYAGLPLLKFYQVYRALVRAKVVLLRETSESSMATAKRYLQVAFDLTTGVEQCVWITFGVSGSGKSTRAMQCVERLGAIRIRSDVERERMFSNRPANEKYSTISTDFVYSRLRELAERIISAGCSVVVDATFLKSDHRLLFSTLAGNLDARFRIIKCEADIETLKKRVSERKNDASEANVDLIETQLGSLDPLSAFENSLVEQGATEMISSQPLN